MAECRVLSEASWKEPAKRQNTVFCVDLEEWETVPGMRWHGRAPKDGSRREEEEEADGGGGGSGEPQGRSGGLFPQGKNAVVQ